MTDNESGIPIKFNSWIGDALVEMMKTELPFSTFKIEGNTWKLMEMFVSSGLVKSKGDAKRLIKQNALSIEVINGVDKDQNPIAFKLLLLRRGKRDIAMVELTH